MYRFDTFFSHQNYSCILFIFDLQLIMMNLIFQSYLNYMHILSSKKKHVNILKDVSGIVKPCR